MEEIIYKGFSFKNWQRTKSFTLVNVNVVKQDLLNHIFTNRGERVALRGFGTDINRLIFEPFDDETITVIADQIRTVINYDPRVTLLAPEDFEVIPDFENSVLLIRARLYYIELDLTDILDLKLEFNS